MADATRRSGGAGESGAGGVGDGADGAVAAGCVLTGAGETTGAMDSANEATGGAVVTGVGAGAGLDGAVAALLGLVRLGASVGGVRTGWTADGAGVGVRDETLSLEVAEEAFSTLSGAEACTSGDGVAPAAPAVVGDTADGESGGGATGLSGTAGTTAATEVDARDSATVGADVVDEPALGEGKDPRNATTASSASAITPATTGIQSGTGKREGARPSLWGDGSSADVDCDAVDSESGLVVCARTAPVPDSCVGDVFARGALSRFARARDDSACEDRPRRDASPAAPSPGDDGREGSTRDTCACGVSSTVGVAGAAARTGGASLRWPTSGPTTMGADAGASAAPVEAPGPLPRIALKRSSRLVASESADSASRFASGAGSGSLFSRRTGPPTRRRRLCGVDTM